MPARSIIAVLGCLVMAAGCDDGGCFEPRPGVSGSVSLQNQSDQSGVLVRIADLDSVAVTDSTGAFSFDDIPDGRWRVEAGYPYFGTDAAEVEVRDGLQRNAIRLNMRQLLRFWVELPDTLVSFCKCERSFEFSIKGYVENLTRSDVILACGSSPLKDYAVIRESEESKERPVMSIVSGRHLSTDATREKSRSNDYDPCREFGMLLPGMLDVPGFVKLAPRESRLVDIRPRLLSECFEGGRYDVFWALVDCSHHWEHYVYDEPDLNRTLFAKPDLLTPASLRLIETSN